MGELKITIYEKYGDKNVVFSFYRENKMGLGKTYERGNGDEKIKK